MICAHELEDLSDVTSFCANQAAAFESYAALRLERTVLFAKAAEVIAFVVPRKIGPPSASAIRLLDPDQIVLAQGANSCARLSTLRPARASATNCSLNAVRYGFLVLGMKNTLIHQ